MPVQAAMLERFAALFLGYELAHGRYEFKRGTSDSGKVTGRPFTVKGRFTLDAVDEHLNGHGPGLGSVPLMHDNTCHWAAIDIDDKIIDHAKLVRQCAQLQLPVVVCRSKSGGAHVYAFFNPPEPAVEVRDRLGQWSAALGYGGCEIFPKQDGRANDDDIGNWINLPYYDADRTVRPAYTAEGATLDFDAFIVQAESLRGPLPAPAALRFEDSKGLFDEGPPCLQQIMANGGLGEGERNEGMFNVAVYLKKRFGDAWDAKVGSYNEELCSPPLKPGELVALAKAANRKNYGFRCTQHPIKPFCQKRACLKRRYGVGGSEPDGEVMSISGITKYTAGPTAPVKWALEVNGTRLMMDTATLFNVGAFNRLCFERLHVVPVQMPQPRWIRYLGEQGPSIDTVELPEEISPEAILWGWVQKFIMQGSYATERSQLVTGRPYHEAGRVYFRMADLIEYLQQNRVEIHDQQFLWSVLKSGGADKTYLNFSINERKTGANVWHVPAPEGLVTPDQRTADPSKGVF